MIAAPHDRKMHSSRSRRRRPTMSEVIVDLSPDRPQMSQHNKFRTDQQSFVATRHICTAQTSTRVPFLPPSRSRQSQQSQKSAMAQPIPLPQLNSRYMQVCQQIDDFLSAKKLQAAHERQLALDVNDSIDDEVCADGKVLRSGTSPPLPPSIYKLNPELAPFTVSNAIQVATLFHPSGNEDENDEDEGGVNKTKMRVQRGKKPLAFTASFGRQGGVKKANEDDDEEDAAKRTSAETLPCNEARYNAMILRIQESLASRDPEGEVTLKTFVPVPPVDNVDGLNHAKLPPPIPPRPSRTLQPSIPSSNALGALPSRRLNDTLLPAGLNDTITSTTKFSSSRPITRGSAAPSLPFSVPRAVPMSPRLGYRSEECKKAVVEILQTFMDNV